MQSTAQLTSLYGGQAHQAINPHTRWVDGRSTLRYLACIAREVNKLKAERDILKKAAAYFAREAT